MSALTLWLTLALAVAGGLVGLWVRADLNRLGYRRHLPIPTVLADDPAGEVLADETNLRPPGRRWWLVVTLAVAWALFALAFDNRGWPWLILWLPFSAVGAWLAEVDRDVRRLPNPVQLGLALWCGAAGIGLAIFGYGNWGIGLGGAAACGLLFFLLNRLSGGNLGLGDVKLVIICGWCLGLLGLGAIAYGLLASCLTAIVWSIVRRQRSFAFGPWLVLGTVVAAIAAGFSWAAAVPLS